MPGQRPRRLGRVAIGQPHGDAAPRHPRLDILGQSALAAEQMVRTGAVEYQPLWRVERHGRAVTPRSLG